MLGIKTKLFSGEIIDYLNLTNRSFKPDFVLIRQNVRDAGVDWKNIIIGLQYGNVPSINSLHSTYNFIDRAWVVSNE